MATLALLFLAISGHFKATMCLLGIKLPAIVTILNSIFFKCQVTFQDLMNSCLHWYDSTYLAAFAQLQ